MRPTFDERDAAIVRQRQHERDELYKTTPGPIEGDAVDMPDGTQRRVSHAWDQEPAIQLTMGYDESFHFTGPTMSFSGSLDRARPTSSFELVGVASSSAWIFHHGQVMAHNGVPCRVMVRRWKLKGE